MFLTRFAEALYPFVSGGMTGLALLLAFASLVARHRGLRRGILMSRPSALYGLIGTVGALAAFYLLYEVTGEPASIGGRGGIVRLLLINLSLALVHWNWDYVMLIARRWDEDGEGDGGDDGG